MSDFDLDRLGDVWRQQPDQAEIESLKRAADAVHSRARWRRVIDIVSALVVSGVVLFLALQNPERDTLVVGACAILILLYGHYRQRRLREADLRSLTGSAEEMIDQSIGRIETTIRHHKAALIGIGPTFLVALLFSATADRGGNLLEPLRDMPWFRVIWIGAWVAVVAMFVIYLLFAIRRARSDLVRLYAMRNAYRQERESAAAE